MITLDYYAEIDIPTVNRMLQPRMGKTKGGKRFPSLFKNPKASAFQESYKWILFAQKKHLGLPDSKSVSRIITFYTFGMTPIRYARGDVTNCIKLVEDALMGMDNALLPYDDSLVTLNGERKVIAEVSFIHVKVGIVIKGEVIQDRDVLIGFLQDGEPVKESVKT